MYSPGGNLNLFHNRQFVTNPFTQKHIYIKPQTRTQTCNMPTIFMHPYANINTITVSAQLMMYA